MKLFLDNLNKNIYPYTRSNKNMSTTFSDLVNDVKKLSLSEKIEIKHIITKTIIDEKREKIYKNYLKSKKEFKDNKLKFSNNINELKKLVDTE